MSNSRSARVILPSKGEFLEQWKNSRTVFLYTRAEEKIFKATYISVVRVLRAIHEDYSCTHIKDTQSCGAARLRKGFSRMNLIQTSRIVEVCQEYHMSLALSFVDC